MVGNQFEASIDVRLQIAVVCVTSLSVQLELVYVFAIG
jgi:hypothetical protein